MFMPGVWILWSKKKKIVIIFQKENGNTFTLLIIFIVKSLQKEQNSTNLLLTPGLSGFWDQSQANSALYIAFWSVEPTDFKNVIVENIPPALSEIDQHAFWNFIENKNDENSIMKSDKN